MTEPKPFLISRAEAELMLRSDAFSVHREIRRPLRMPKDGTDTKLIEALIVVCKHQVGDVFWLKEDFKISYDENRNETWIQFAVDNRLALGTGTVHGRTQFAKNGIYTGKLMERWMSRGEIVLTDVKVESKLRRRFKQWYWCLTFNKKKDS